MKRILALSLLLALLCACGGSSGDGQEKQIDLAVFAQTLQEDHEFPILNRLDPADEFDAVMLESIYPGLKDMDLKQIEVYLASSFSGVELALVQAKSTDDNARVKKIFDARVAAKTTEGSNNYPDAAKLWQYSSAVVSNGSYIMLVNHEDSAAIVSEFNGLLQ